MDRDGMEQCLQRGGATREIAKLKTRSDLMCAPAMPGHPKAAGTPVMVSVSVLEMKRRVKRAREEGRRRRCRCR